MSSPGFPFDNNPPSPSPDFPFDNNPPSPSPDFPFDNNPPSPSPDFPFNNSPSPSPFPFYNWSPVPFQAGGDANDSINIAAIAAIISSIVGVVALVLIVYFIIKCLRKRSGAIKVQQGDAYSDVISMSPAITVINDTQVELATMERFLNDIAREKPTRFSPQQLINFTHNYATRLGSGGFGVVYKGESPNGVQVAVKVLNQSSDKGAEEQFMAEVSTIGRTYHINLVRLYGFCFDTTVKALVYEYMENGSLDKFLFDKNRQIELGRLYEIALGTAKGIAYLHEECQQRIIHYDIKPGNILLDANFSPKVADFGLAKLCNRDNSHVVLTRGRGTPGYAAPELYMPFPVTRKCDVYSFGMLLFEIVGRRTNLNVNQTESREWFPRWVWEKYEKGELAEVTLDHETDEKDREKAERMCMVALWCVQYLPEARPPMSNVVKMLEGNEMVAPPNPFQHLMDSGTGLNLWNESSTHSIETGSSCEVSYKESNCVMRKDEIELANSLQ